MCKMTGFTWHRDLPTIIEALILRVADVPGFELFIRFAQEDLNDFYLAGRQVLITQTNPSDATTIIWQDLHPFEINEVVITDCFGIFATTGPLLPGKAFKISAQTDAAPGQWYPYTPTGFQGVAMEPKIPAAAYGVINLTPDPPTIFGLTQCADINGVEGSAAPLNSVTSPSKTATMLIPPTTAYVYAGDGKAGNVIDQPVTNALAVSITPGGSTSIWYDKKSQTFVDPS